MPYLFHQAWSYEPAWKYLCLSGTHCITCDVLALGGLYTCRALSCLVKGRGCNYPLHLFISVVFMGSVIILNAWFWTLLVFLGCYHPNAWPIFRLLDTQFLGFSYFLGFSNPNPELSEACLFWDNDALYFQCHCRRWLTMGSMVFAYTACQANETVFFCLALSFFFFFWE